MASLDRRDSLVELPEAGAIRDAVQIGRTHGIHAEPITFGLKLALLYDEVTRNGARLRAAAEELRVGKISGAVGTFGHIGPEAEELICAKLDLKPAPIARCAPSIAASIAMSRTCSRRCCTRAPHAGARWSRSTASVTREKGGR